MVKIDRTGNTFNRLTVIKEVDSTTRGRPRWLCQCICGNTTEADSSSLTSGAIKSCGCLQTDVLIERNTTHNMSYSREYSSWQAMNTRCNNPNYEKWHRYGGRGIVICNEWENFEQFYKDMGDRPDGMTLDRYPNPDGNYEPTNCRWATSIEQHLNKGIV